MKYLFAVVTILVMISLYACKTNNITSQGNGMSKLDVQSQIELTRAEQANSEDMIGVVMLFEEEPTDIMLDELKEMKVKIITKVGKIITAKANVESIRKLIKYDKVKQIDINKSKQYFQK